MSSNIPINFTICAAVAAAGVAMQPVRSISKAFSPERTRSSGSNVFQIARLYPFLNLLNLPLKLTLTKIYLFEF